jgi:hypothetical protein
LSAIARAAHRRLGRDQFLRVGQAFGACIDAFAQAIDQAERQRFLGPRVAAAQHQVQRGLHANQAWRALRAAGAGHQAQLHLRQAQLGGRHGQAVVRRKSDLQPAAERGAMDRGQHRLAAVLDAAAHLGQRGRLRRLAELADVGTGNEVAARAGDQHRGHGAVGFGRVDRGDQAAAHIHAEGVDRRVVDADDQHIGLALEADGI